MGFYEQISTYYDYIFPVGQSQLDFIVKQLPNPPAKVLDVACGSGGYSVELTKRGYDVCAIDLDDEMVRLAKKKAIEAKLNIDVRKCNMLDISSQLEDSYNLIFCIGNSIVHLGSHQQITVALEQMHQKLKPGGKLLIQIINYDRILKNKVDFLPTLKDENVPLVFQRKYEYQEDSGIINFNTVLTVGADKEEIYENSIELLPITSSCMKECLEKAGFNKFSLYGDFSGSAYDEDAFLLVIEAIK